MQGSFCPLRAAAQPPSSTDCPLPNSPEGAIAGFGGAREATDLPTLDLLVSQGPEHRVPGSVFHFFIFALQSVSWTRRLPEISFSSLVWSLSGYWPD